MEKIIVRSIYSIIFLIITFIISICLIWSKNNSLIGIIVMSVLIAMMICINKVLSKLENSLSCKAVNIIFAASMVLIVVIQLITASKLAVFPSWDFEIVYNQAVRLAENPSAPISEYFAKYPNNIGLLYILAKAFRVSNILNIKHYLRCGIILNIVFVDFSIIFMYLSCKKLFGKKECVIFCILSIMFIPYYIYMPIIYTDTIAMFFVAAVVYLFADFIKAEANKRKILYLIMIGIAAAWGFKIKATIAILLVAVMIYMIIRLAVNRKNLLIQALSIIILISSFIGASKATNYVINKSIYIPDEMYFEYKVPYEHWIMMGLKGVGFYDPYDVVFSKNSGNYDQKKAAEIKVIKERLNNYGSYGLLKHIIKKSVFTWDDGSYYAIPLLTNSIKTSGLHQLFTYKGKYYNVYHYYSYGYHLMLLCLLLIPIIKRIRDPELDSELMLYMAFTGLILFLFMWENTPRYVLHFMGIAILLSAKSIVSINRKRK